MTLSRPAQATSATAQSLGADEVAVMGQKSVNEAAAAAAYPIREAEGALRLGAALRAAHQEDAERRSPGSEAHEWNWIVKALPRPPLVAMTKEELDCEQLLANDSLGG
jgi:hypothetical protein